MTPSQVLAYVEAPRSPLCQGSAPPALFGGSVVHPGMHDDAQLMSSSSRGLVRTRPVAYWDDCAFKIWDRSCA